MYNVSKGPTQMIEKTRRGVNHKLENIERFHEMTAKNRGVKHGGAEGKGKSGYLIGNNSTQIPVFHSSSGSSPGTKHRYHQRASQEKITPQQEEIINYINAKWTATERELRENPTGKVIYYQDAEPNPSLRDFEPFDLESWWGQRLYRHLTEGSKTSGS